MPDTPSHRVPDEFQPYLLSVPPGTKKTYGHGTWDVACPKCGAVRHLQTYKVKSTGRIIGAEHLCDSCARMAKLRQVALKCPVCGKVRMIARKTATARLSSLCRDCFNARGAPRHKRNDRHATRTANGYIVLLGMVGHPMARRNQVLEHWLTLYEQHPMGPDSVLWFKKQGFTVHHRNGIRDDNRLENLELMAKGKHPNGWSIEEMEEAIRRYRNKETANAVTRPPSP